MHLEGARLVVLPELGTRMQRWDVSCLRMLKRKLSAHCPLVPFSSAKGGSHPLGGTMQAMPALSTVTSISSNLITGHHSSVQLQKEHDSVPGIAASLVVSAQAKGLTHM